MTIKQPVDQTSLPPIEEVAQAIVDIAAAMKRMNMARLKQDGIVILLHAQCTGRVNKSQIRLVLDEMARMDEVWLKPLEASPKAK